jgi:Tol biopolymer transport system component
MGQVYRARDTRLNRDVAIKVLLPAVANDPDRLARFSREAQLLASLNHQNIAHVHGLEESEGTRALVMEFVEGEPLSARIARGVLALDEALAIARQIADALEAAHERGIVHRDLKPANIMVMAEGQVKVLDFGLAKAIEAGEAGATGRAGADETTSPTMTSPAMTAAGMILGTAAYMAPEQARGKSVDKRADIWAFGVIVFEMLTGKPLFAADSIADTFAAIVSKTPDWSQLPHDIRPLVQAALEKDPRRRLRDIGDAFRLVGSATATAQSQPPRRSGVLAAMGAVALLALAVAIAGWLRQTPTPTAPELRLQITLPRGAQPDFGISVSPDGRRVVFVVPKTDGTRGAWIRELNNIEARPIPGAENLDTAPVFWSPDGRWIGFSSAGTLQKVDVLSGGPAVRIASVGQIGAAWNTDGTIVYGTNPGGNGGGSVFRVAASGGTPVQLTNVDTSRGEYAHHHPTFLPDGRHFLYLRAARAQPDNRSGIYVGSIDATPDQQSTERLIATTFGPVFFVPSKGDSRGFLLFLRDGSLVAQRFDPATLALSGEPQQVATPVGGFIDRALFFVGGTGTIVYTAAAPVFSMQFTWVDREGKTLRTVGEPGVVSSAVRSPDGRRVATTVVDIGSATEKRELWISDLERGTKSLFWFKSPVMGPPVWSPDSTRVLFPLVDNGPQLYERALDGVQDGRVLFKGNRGEPLGASSWSPDGRFVLFNRLDQATANDIWAVSVSDGTATPLLKTPAPERDGQFSPDGRWIAYTATDGGRQEVYVTAVTSFSPTVAVGGGPWRVSSGGGNLPRWRADGREIFYAGPTSMMAAPVSTGSGFAAGTPVAVGGTAGQNTFGRFGFIDASRDGRELLFARPATNDASREPVNVIVNWTPDASR